MGKRVVVGLDPSEHSKAAVQVACGRAKLYDGILVGVAIVDTPGIERSGSYAPVGAGHYADQAIQHHLDEAEKQCDVLLADFEAACKSAGVRCEHQRRHGEPVDMLVEVSLSADLVVVGTRTFFNYRDEEDDPGDTLQKLLKERVCPVLAVPKNPPEVERILFPYNGSNGTARAMRSITYQTPQSAIHIPVTLLNVNDDAEQGKLILEAPARYLHAHNRPTEIRVEKGSPREVVLRVAKELGNVMVVLGASDKSTLGSLVFGSVTKSMLEDGTVLMFISA